MLQERQKPSRLITRAYKYLSQLTSPLGSAAKWGRNRSFQDSGLHKAAEARNLLPIAVDMAEVYIVKGTRRK